MPLTTIRVLLVEDEIMIRMMVADMVEELGHAVAAEAGDVGSAAKLAQTGLFDLAILDVNLNGTVKLALAQQPSALRDHRRNISGFAFRRVKAVAEPSVHNETEFRPAVLALISHCSPPSEEL